VSDGIDDLPEFHLVLAQLLFSTLKVLDISIRSIVRITSLGLALLEQHKPSPRVAQLPHNPR
jgi:hypothetical protein